MADGYTDIPQNMSAIAPYVTVDRKTITEQILNNERCFFYDACSFQRHANLKPGDAEYLLRYIRFKDGVVIITRCILMELAARKGVLDQRYVKYIKHVKDAGIMILIIYEEDLFSIMETCFSTNIVINQYLSWAVRMAAGPVSTITEMLEENQIIYNQLIRGRNLNQKNVYQCFFKTMREKKESGDNLGEELLAVCLHILSHIPGEKDGKFCVITDDKGAASKIDLLLKKTAKQYKGKKVIIFSTPKFVQTLYRENILREKDKIEAILKTGVSGNIKILGMRIFDLRRKEISMSVSELTDYIMQPDGIHIIF